MVHLHIFSSILEQIRPTQVMLSLHHLLFLGLLLLVVGLPSSKAEDNQDKNTASMSSGHKATHRRGRWGRAAETRRCAKSCCKQCSVDEPDFASRVPIGTTEDAARAKFVWNHHTVRIGCEAIVLIWTNFESRK